MWRRRVLFAALLAGAIAAGVVAATRSPGPGSSGQSGSGGALSAGRGGSVRIDPAGAIGPLRMNRSSKAQVIAWAGTPSVDAYGRYTRVNPRYEVLGYRCARGAVTKKYWTGYPVDCRTAFYMVGGRLSFFLTYDPRFSADGVRVGTPEQRAERLLHRQAASGCSVGIGLQGKRTSLTVALTGKGDSVSGLFLHGLNDPHVTDCF